MSQITLTGISSRTYQFTIGDMSAPWNDVAGVYAFVSQSLLSRSICYIGECGSFKSRMNPHDRWIEGVRDHGVTIIATLGLNNALSRFEIERDLIAAYNPVMNTHHRTGLAGIAAMPSGNGLIGLSGLKFK